MDHLEVASNALIPIYTEESKNVFCRFTKPKEIDYNGIKLKTNHLRTSVPIDLLGVSQSRELINEGWVDSTDAIDPSVVLKELVIRFVKGGHERVYVHEIPDMTPLTAFYYTPHSDYRRVDVNFTTKIKVPRLDESFDLNLAVTGQINLELGNCCIDGSVDRTESRFDKAEEIAIVGYSLKAARINHNRRTA